MDGKELKKIIENKWPKKVCCYLKNDFLCEINLTSLMVLPEISKYLFEVLSFNFGGLIVEEQLDKWCLRYVFYGRQSSVMAYVIAFASLDEKVFPSIVKSVPAADWHEREAEDLFGLIFQGHPRLGDFMLHDDVWQENIEPMRRDFDPIETIRQRHPNKDWRPRCIVQEPGIFLMPIGPKYSGISESAHFMLETVGENIIRFIPRLFYKWRAVEKIAEGNMPERALLLAERFAGTTAFAHGLAFCRAVEACCDASVPDRAKYLRVFLSELERLRHHAGAIHSICQSTGLAVAASQFAILEEDLLRISCELTGHRYLFGILAIGGLSKSLSYTACESALHRAEAVLKKMNRLKGQLYLTGSFLDRLEKVGVVTKEQSISYGLVGPVARACGVSVDLRRGQSYTSYGDFNFDVAEEDDGDGYARLRVLFAEASQSVRIMQQVLGKLNRLDSERISSEVKIRESAALGWVESPRGAAFHWVRLGKNGRIMRYRIIPPSFANWHGFHLSVENFAFQDFPIILSTFILSVAENDR